MHPPPRAFIGMTKEEFENLLALVEERLAPKKKAQNQAIEAKEKLIFTLR
jgi:hypothetical protein